MKKEINTRFNETRFVTSSPEEMRGLYLASTLKRTWTDDYLDEETGNVISVDRSEVVAQLGDKIDGDLMARIQFHLQAGDIKQVEVSTQQRMAYLTTDYYLIPWSVTAVIGDKRRKILLYADSAQMAHDIAKDYIELHYSGAFHIVGLKVFEHCIFIRDTLKAIAPDNETGEDPDAAPSEFYKVEAEIRFRDGGGYKETFVLLTKNVDSAGNVIHDWIVRYNMDNPALSEEQKAKATDFDLTILSGVTIPCFCVIEREFSDAYMKAKE